MTFTVKHARRTIAPATGQPVVVRIGDGVGCANALQPGGSVG